MFCAQHQSAGLGIFAVHAEVTQPEELVVGGGLGIGQRGLQFAALQHLQGVGVQAVQEVLIPGVRVGVGEQVVVQAYLGVHGGGGVHPV